MGSVTELTNTELEQKSWQGWELYALAENCSGNPIAVVTTFDAAQTIVVEEFELFPVLHAEWPRLTAIKQDGPDCCRVERQRFQLLTPD